MGSLNLLSFRPGSSLIHRIDTRARILCLCLLSLASAAAGGTGLLLLIGVAVAGLWSAGLRPTTVIRQSAWVMVLIAAVFLARCISASEINSAGYWQNLFSMESITEGLTASGRFLSVLLFGILFSATTRPSSIKGSVAWYLKPFPFLPAQRIGVMMTLFMRFFPLTLKQARELSDARKARCVHLDRRPVRRAVLASVPLLKKSFSTADRLATAMEARCYSDDRTDPVLVPSGREAGFITGVVLMSALAVFL